MTHSEILRKSLEMTMDELQDKIMLYTSAINIMNEVKKIRIRDGEKTEEMIKRQARRSAAKQQAKPVVVEQPEKHAKIDAKSDTKPGDETSRAY